MRRPLLPLGSAAPWVLGAVAAVLLVLGLIGGSREMVFASAVALFVLIVAFPLAALLLGKDHNEDE